MPPYGRSTALRYASGPAAIERPASPVLVACGTGSFGLSLKRWASVGGPQAIHVSSMARAMDAVESGGRPRALVAAASFGGGFGLDLVSRIHALFPGVPSLIVQGTQKPSELLRARQLGASYLDDGADPARIAAAVTKVALGSLPFAREAERVIDAFSAARDLSRREHEILSLFVRGVARCDLAEVMGVRENTLKTEVRALLAKCECSSLEELFRHLFQMALSGGPGGHVSRNE